MHTISSFSTIKKGKVGRKVLVLGDADLGKPQKSILQVGRKVYTELSMKNAERLASARSMARCARESEQGRCVGDWVDTVLRGKAPPTNFVSITAAARKLVSKKLWVMESDKEWYFVVLPN